jgi:hypothetical protein
MREIVHIMVRVDKKFHAELAKRAKREMTTISDLVRTAVRADLEKYNEKQAKAAGK